MLHLYPFSAIVGQEDLSLALILNAISPTIGGVLIRGEKGTAKSTAARALANLLPPIEVVEGCPFACAPNAPAPDCPFCTTKMALSPSSRPVRLINLPLGATEDRVLGTIDLERALKKGERHFEPGLLAAAHRGVLYIDEVNLLPDHLVDLLLDAAAMGRNVVEREGLSFSHAARFVLVGTMNPEEGELRPQLLDRFGLSVNVSGLIDSVARTEVVRRRLAYEKDPPGFAERFATEEDTLRKRIKRASEKLFEVEVPEDILTLISSICLETGVDGMRADIALYKSAQALAAYADRSEVTVADVARAATFVLPHRRRRQPFSSIGLNEQQLEEMIERLTITNSKVPAEALEPPPEMEPPSQIPSPVPPQQENRKETEPLNGEQERLEEEREPAKETRQSERKQEEESLEEGERSAPLKVEAPLEMPASPGIAALRGTNLTNNKYGEGRHGLLTTRRGKTGGAGVKLAQDGRDLALTATLLAAAPHQKTRNEERAPDDNDLLFKVERRDLRQVRRTGKTNTVILFVVDASGSMGAQARMSAVKGAIIGLLMEAYQKRDEVGLIVCHGNGAELILPPTGSIEQAESLLTALPTGGRTPLAQGLQLAAQVLKGLKQKMAEQVPLLVVVSDGRANVPLDGKEGLEATYEMAARLRENGLEALVLDTEQGYVRLGLARKLAEVLGAPCHTLEEITGTSVRQAVEARRQEQA